MKDPHHSLKHLTRVCLLTDLTLMLAWSYDEAGKIIETYKVYEHKPPDLIMEKIDSDPHVKVIIVFICEKSAIGISLNQRPFENVRVYVSLQIASYLFQLVSALTSVRSVNKTDAAMLLNNFGSLEKIIKASNHELCLCPGLGQQKATRLYNVLHEPFLKGDKRKKLGIARYFD